MTTPLGSGYQGTYLSTTIPYYLLRHVPSGKDADFSSARLIAAHDAEVSDELGNLARRLQVLVHRHAGGRIPDARTHR